MSTKPKPKQLDFFKKHPSAYGGDLLKTRKGRSRPRPLDTRHTMHLVLRSTKARGKWSFRRPENARKIQQIIDRFSVRHGVRVLSLANVGNHLHFQIKLSNRHLYRPFIRAVTAAIAMAVTGASRWAPAEGKFWDHRPFTRIVQGLRAVLGVRDYIQLNQLEAAYDLPREYARWLIQASRGVTRGS